MLPNRNILCSASAFNKLCVFFVIIWFCAEAIVAQLCSDKNCATRREYDLRGKGWSDRRLDFQSSYGRIYVLDLRLSNTQDLGPRTLEVGPWRKDLGGRILNLGLRTQNLGIGHGTKDIGHRSQNLGLTLRTLDSGCNLRTQDLGVRIQDLELRIKD